MFPERSDDELRVLDQSTVDDWDSLASLSLLTVIEEEFEITFDDDADRGDNELPGRVRRRRRARTSADGPRRVNPKSLLRSVALSRAVSPVTHWVLGEREARLPDIEIRQLRGMLEAYAGSSGPEILLLGDSTMFWTRAGESDQRT